MSDCNALHDLLRHKVKSCSERIEGWSTQIEDLQDQITKLNRWITFEQGDLEDAQTMLDKMETKDETRT